MGLFTKSSVGLEIDAREIRGIELKGNTDKPFLLSWGRISLEPGIISDGMVLNSQKLGEALSKLWQISKIRSRKVILGISNQGVIIRKAIFPMVSEEKLGSLIHYQAQDYLPVPVDSVVLDYMKVGELQGQEGDKVEVLLVAAQLDMLDGFVKALSHARLEPYDMQVTPLSLQETLPCNARQGVVIAVDISNELGSLLGLVEGTPRFARSLRIRMQEATGLNPATQMSSLCLPEVLLSTWTQILYNEIRSSINYFLSQERADKVDRILLSGCGSRIEGIDKMLEEALGVPVEIIDPCLKLCKLPDVKRDFKNQAADFTICINLALAGLGG